MPAPGGSTWETFLQQQQLTQGPADIDLKTVQAGDRLVVGTKNTRYEFEWREDGTALLSTNRPDRPWGSVTVIGCAFRQTGIVAPGIAFRGGKLEFLSTERQVRHRTTAINSLNLIRAEARPHSLAPIQSDAAR